MSELMLKSMIPNPDLTPDLIAVSATPRNVILFNQSVIFFGQYQWSNLSWVSSPSSTERRGNLCNENLCFSLPSKRRCPGLKIHISFVNSSTLFPIKPYILYNPLSTLQVARWDAVKFMKLFRKPIGSPSLLSWILFFYNIVGHSPEGSGSRKKACLGLVLLKNIDLGSHKALQGQNKAQREGWG